MIRAAAPCAAADRKSEPIPDNYFCMHVHSKPGFEQAFSEVPFKIYRTWDSSIGWPLIEPENDKWNWELLDRYVELAAEKNIKIILTLGMTPPWASKDPDAPSPYGDCCSSAPPANIDDWKDYIRKVAERNEEVYNGAIRYWEVWNEPDNIHRGYAFYTGTIGELVEMGRAAHEVLKSVNPENMMLAPGITQMGGDWLDNFLSGGGSDYVDIIAFHFYWDWHSPSISDFRSTAATLKSVMKINGLEDMPLWLTETGINVNYYKTVEERASTLALMLAAPWYYGSDVVCAYSWNNGIFTTMYDVGNMKTTELNNAYVEIHRWLTGAAITGIGGGKNKTRIISLDKNGKTAEIIWRRTGGTALYEVENGDGNTIFNLDGTHSQTPEDRIIEIGNSPVLICDGDFFSNQPAD